MFTQALVKTLQITIVLILIWLVSGIEPAWGVRPTPYPVTKVNVDIPPQLCRTFGEMAIGARAFAIENINKNKAMSIIKHWYGFTLAGDRAKDLVRIAQAVLDAAYKDERDPYPFALALFTACEEGQAKKFFSGDIVDIKH